MQEVTQYIGARYVTKFHQNSVDPSSIEWDANQPYEPMTVVSYLGDSYTSKIPVPATVGNPADNPNYWAKTGAFNAAIEALQEELGSAEHDIATNAGNITDLQTALGTAEGEIETNTNAINALRQLTLGKKVIFVGDSYVGQSQWVSKIATRLGMTQGTDYFCYSLGGEGFTEGVDDNGFLDDLKYFEDLIATDVKQQVTDILVVGGVNDAKTANNYAIETGIENFVTYAKQQYPNAKIYIGFIGAIRLGGSAVSTRTMDNMELCYYLYNVCSRHGAIYLSNVEYALRQTDAQLQTDGLHPTSTSGNAIADAVINAWLGGSADTSWIPTGITCTSAITGDTGNKYLRYYSRGSEFRLEYNSSFNCNFAAAEDIDGGNIPTVIATQDKIFFNRAYYAYAMACVYLGGGTKQAMPVLLKFEGYNIGLSIPNCPAGYWDVVSCTKVILTPFTLVGHTFDLS